MKSQILGIGTDITHVARFASWAQYSERQLLKIYSPQELQACTHPVSGYIPEKLAVRFAAKEAFFKALSQTLVTRKQTDKTFSFLSVAPLICVTQATWDIPQISVDWELFEQKTGVHIPNVTINLSLAHEKTHAIAFVIIS